MSAQGKDCIVGDADDSYDFSRLSQFVEQLRSGADLVMGNRFLGGIAPRAMPWKNRYVGNPVLTGIGRFLFRCPSKDFHCGLRAFSKDAFKRMNLRTTGMEFASEMVIKATITGMRIAEVPTTLSPDGRTRPPHLRPYRDGLRHLRFMLLFSPNWLFMYPGLALIALGVVLGGLLLAEPIYIKGIRFGLDTLIYCMTMIEVGFQATLFAILSRAYAVQEGLFPRPSRTPLVEQVFSLTRGILLGVGFFSVGVGLMIYAVWLWHSARFGDLDIEQVARIVVGSSLSISLGFETILASLFLSTLKLNVRSLPNVDVADQFEA